MDSTNPNPAPAAPAYADAGAADASTKPRRPWPIRILKGIIPLLVIALGVYIVYNFPALWQRLTYTLNKPQPGNPAALPASVGGGAPVGAAANGPECGHPIDYDGNGNPKRICDNYIYIPKIRVAAPIIRPASTSESVVDDALLKGVIRYPQTAEPGQKGNVFLTGHSSYYWWVPTEYRNVFTLVPQLQDGDEMFIYYNGIRYGYKVFTTFEVSPNETGVLAQTPKPILTLSTCVPIGTSYRRKIVQANQVSPNPSAARSPSGQARQPARLPGVR